MALDPITGVMDVLTGLFDFMGKHRETMRADLRDRLDTILVEDITFWHDLTAQLRIDARKKALALEPPPAHPPPVIVAPPK